MVHKNVIDLTGDSDTDVIDLTGDSDTDVVKPVVLDKRGMPPGYAFVVHGRGYLMFGDEDLLSDPILQGV